MFLPKSWGGASTLDTGQQQRLHKPTFSAETEPVENSVQQDSLACSNRFGAPEYQKANAIERARATDTDIRFNVCL